MDIDKCQKYFKELFDKFASDEAIDDLGDIFDKLEESMPNGWKLCDRQSFVDEMVGANLAALQISWESYVRNVCELPPEKVTQALNCFQEQYASNDVLPAYYDEYNHYMSKAKFRGNNAEISANKIGQAFVDKVLRAKKLGSFGWYKGFVEQIQGLFRMTLVSNFTSFVSAKIRE
jgi:hypothetical protein